jgi:hypothetical protein
MVLLPHGPPLLLLLMQCLAAATSTTAAAATSGDVDATVELRRLARTHTPHCRRRKSSGSSDGGSGGGGSGARRAIAATTPGRHFKLPSNEDILFVFIFIITTQGRAASPVCIEKWRGRQISVLLFV